jgi:hypothetical protein
MAFTAGKIIAKKKTKEVRECGASGVEKPRRLERLG